MPVEMKEFAQLLDIVTKARENAPRWLDPRVKAKIVELGQELEESDPAWMSENDYKKHMAAATLYLKAVAQAKKDGDPKKEEEATWKVVKYVDEGDCASAAKKASIDGLETAYKNAVKKFEEYAINEGHLGVLYEKNILTKGSKFSFFFKYVRTKKDFEAELVGVAIGSHGGSGNNYYRLKADGTQGTVKISAQKKM